MTRLEASMIEEGVEAVFKKLCPGKAIRFFQSMGLNKGDSVKEMENKSCFLLKCIYVYMNH